MTVLWAGITVVGSVATVVWGTLGGGELVINGDSDITLESGDRAEAAAHFFERMCDFVKNTGIKHVVIKASAVSGRGAATDGLLASAELRGVTIAAAAKAGAKVVLQKRAALSRDKSKRKVDAYLTDERWWSAKLGSSIDKLRKGSREAAFFILAQDKV